MKPFFSSSIWVLAGVLSVLVACKKPADLPSPDAEKPVHPLTLVIHHPPGDPALLNNTWARVSIKNLSGTPLVRDTVVAVTYQQNKLSTVLALAAGNYEIVKFLIQRADQTTLYASPLKGSVKAQQVGVALGLATGAVASATTLNIEVLKVGMSDRAEDYGYQPGVFTLPGDNNQQENFTFTLQTVIGIGKVTYDSIPAGLHLTTYDANGDTFTQPSTLAAGTQSFTLSKKNAKYKLRVFKWGEIYERIILPAEMQNGLKIVMGGEQVAKRLKTESIAIQSGALWIASTRNEFEYDANSRLAHIRHLKKDANQNTVSAGTTQITYENGRMARMVAAGTASDKTTTFVYNAGGKLETIREKDGEGEKTTTVFHSAAPGQSGAAKNYRIEATSIFSQYTYQQTQTLDLIGANAFRSTKHTNHGDAETVMYSHDQEINPYIHLGIPDLDPRNHNIHNMLSRGATYSIAIPNFEPYSFAYTYDGEGYPTAIITKYRDGHTRKDAHVTKTLLTYY